MVNTICICSFHYNHVITCAKFHLKQMWGLTKAMAEMKREHWTKRWNWSSYTKLALSASSTIVIKNGKTVWKHWPYCWHFCFNLKYLRWPYRAYIKPAKNGDFCEELLSENDFGVVLATFCCYDHGAKASKAVQKIATDQKKYRKCSSCVLIC